MTTPPSGGPGAPGRPSRRFYLPAALLVVAGVERVMAGREGPGWLVALGVALASGGALLAIAVHRARRRG